MALACKVRGQISWLGEKRENQSGGREERDGGKDKEGGTENQASNEQKITAHKIKILSKNQESTLF